jgi:hypothetical protein
LPELHVKYYILYTLFITSIKKKRHSIIQEISWFYRKSLFITELTRVQHWSLCWSRQIQFTLSFGNHFTITSGSPEWFFFIFLLKFCSRYLSYFLTCYTSKPWYFLELIDLIKFGEEYISWMVNPCGIFGGQSGIETGFFSEFFGFPLSYHSTIFLQLISSGG